MLYLICLTIGIIFLILSLVLLKRSVAFVKSGEKVIGKVTELIEQRNDSEGTVYAPVFEFTTSLNEVVTYRHHVLTSPPGWAIGDKTTLIFDPAKPDSTRLLTYSIFSWNMVLMGIAVTLIVTGLGYCLFFGYIL